MSTDSMKDKLKGNFGALQGLKKQESVDNSNDNANHNRIDNANPTQISNNTGKVSSIEDKLKGITSKSRKRKIKNVTYGLYEDQQEDVREIASELGLGVNEFMRESMDIVIELFKQQMNDEK